MTQLEHMPVKQPSLSQSDYWVRLLVRVILIKIEITLLAERFFLESPLAYSCFEKGCPTEKHQSVRDNTERHDGLWLFTVASSSSRVFTAMEGGAMDTCLRVLKETKWILSF